MAPPGVVTRGANRLGARTCATMAAPAAGRNVGAGRAATAGPAGGPQLRGRLGGRNGEAGRWPHERRSGGAVAKRSARWPTPAYGRATRMETAHHCLAVPGSRAKGPEAQSGPRQSAHEDRAVDHSVHNPVGIL